MAFVKNIVGNEAACVEYGDVALWDFGVQNQALQERINELRRSINVVFIRVRIRVVFVYFNCNFLVILKSSVYILFCCIKNGSDL